MVFVMVSLRAYARSRGCSLRGVQKAIASGRLVDAVTADSKGRPKIVSIELADREWAANTDESFHRGLPCPQAASNVKPAEPSPAATPFPPFAESKARRERALAEMAEIELAARRGELIAIAAVTAGWTNIITRARTHLLALPSKAKATLPHLSLADVSTLDRLVRAALEELAEAGDTGAP